MNTAVRVALIAVVLPSVAGFLSLEVMATEPTTGRSDIEQSSAQIRKHTDNGILTRPSGGAGKKIKDQSVYPPDQYVIGEGQGDMAKGPVVCRRVSELLARADLAKQIRVLVKEHMVDRIRDRTGRDLEQDIEVTREEIVEEYLQGVKIIDHRIDQTNNTCSTTAVMPKSQISPKPASEHPGSNPVVPR